MYRYFVLPDDAVHGSGEIRADAIERFFVIVRQVTGMERSVSEPLLHSGRRIQQGGFTIWAERINPFKPAKIV